MLLRLVAVALTLLGACAGAGPMSDRRAEFEACRRLDARPGTAPSARLSCWTLWRSQGSAHTPAGATSYADARIEALSGTNDPLKRLDPNLRTGRPAPLPDPETHEPEAACSPSCLDAAQRCDRTCAQSHGWADCLSQCDRELTVCCFGR